MSFEPWSVADRLEERSVLEVRFSRGFLRGNPVDWFANLGSQWLPLFHSLSSTPKFLDASTHLDFPSGLLRVTAIEIDDELAVIGLDENAVNQLSALVADDLADGAADIFLEYLERRLCTTLRAAWTDDEPMLVQYNKRDDAEEIEISASIAIRLQLMGPAFDVWIGCGPRLVERLDFFVRRQMQPANLTDLSDQVKNISVELAELWVPPSVLIDYMRANTVIDLERPALGEVKLLLEGQPWATGELCLFNDTLAVEVKELDDSKLEVVEGNTRLSVILATTPLDAAGIREHHQPGAILSLGIAPPETVDIVIGGETVANAGLGEVDGRLAVQVRSMK